MCCVEEGWKVAECAGASTNDGEDDKDMKVYIYIVCCVFIIVVL